MKPHRKAESGSVLVLALLVTMVILAIGLVAMWLSSSEMQMTGNISRRQEALYAAEAGLERARATLMEYTNWSDPVKGCDLTSPPNDPGDPAAGHKGFVLCDPSGNMLYNMYLVDASSQTKAKAPGTENLRYTVYIRNDDAEIAQKAPDTSWYNNDDDKRVVIRVEATGRDGLSFFAIETVMSQSVVIPVEENYLQQGGSAQNLNSDEGTLPLPP